MNLALVHSLEPAVDNARLMALFDEYCAAGAQAPGTRKLKAVYIGALARQYNLATCTTADVVAFLSSNPDWSPSTRRSARSSLTTFFAWMRRSGHRPDDPAVDTIPVRVAQHPPRPCPEAALDAAIAKADDRMRLALLLGAYAGLRRAEICRVHADDIDLETMTLRVLGKGRKERLVPIAEALAAPLAAVQDSGGYAFSSADGHITPDAMGKVLSRLLGPGLTAHTLRHRFATKVFSGSKNLRATQELLGHSSVATTQRYTLVSDAERRAAVAVLD